jgi:hypothetical protein
MCLRYCSRRPRATFTICGADPRVRYNKHACCCVSGAMPGRPYPASRWYELACCLRSASTGKVPASMAARTQARAAAWNSFRHNGEQNRCGLPPVARGKNCRWHQRQQTGSVIVGFEAGSLALGDEAKDCAEPPEITLGDLDGPGEFRFATMGPAPDRHRADAAE